MLRVFAQAVAFLDRLRFGLEDHAEIYRDYDSLNNATQLHINNESVGHGDRTRITLAIDVVNGSNFIRLVAREAGPETSLTIHSDGYVDLGSGEFRTQNFQLNGWLETALNGETISSLSGTINNLDPPNDSRRVRLNASGPVVLTGLTGASAGRLRTLVNPSKEPIILRPGDTGSDAGNRFICPDEQDWLLSGMSSVELWADPTISGWRVMAQPGPQRTQYLYLTGNEPIARASQSVVVSDDTATHELYLPDDPQAGDMVWVRPRSAENIDVYPGTGHTIETLSSFTVARGESVMLVFVPEESDWIRLAYAAL